MVPVSTSDIIGNRRAWRADLAKRAKEDEVVRQRITHDQGGPNIAARSDFDGVGDSASSGTTMPVNPKACDVSINNAAAVSNASNAVIESRSPMPSTSTASIEKTKGILKRTHASVTTLSGVTVRPQSQTSNPSAGFVTDDAATKKHVSFELPGQNKYGAGQANASDGKVYNNRLYQSPYLPAPHCHDAAHLSPC